MRDKEAVIAETREWWPVVQQLVGVRLDRLTPEGIRDNDTPGSLLSRAVAETRIQLQLGK